MAAGLPVITLLVLVLAFNGAKGISPISLAPEPNFLKQQQLELLPVSGRMDELLEELNDSLARFRSV